MSPVCKPRVERRKSALSVDRHLGQFDVRARARRLRPGEHQSDELSPIRRREIYVHAQWDVS